MSRNKIDPENKQSIDTQTARLCAYLLSGHKFHCYHPARRKMEIGSPPQRIFDLRDKFGLKPFIKGDMQRGIGNNGNKSRYIEYRIDIDEIPTAIGQLISQHPIFFAKVRAQGRGV